MYELLSFFAKKEIIESMDVFVCIGSSCHLKGSYDVIKGFQELVAANDMTDRINLNASFCLGECTHGVTIKVDDRIITGVRKDNITEIFNTYLKETI